MQLGEKIKRLRSAKLMTQAELAGSEITRNMLSRIENGAAQPSIGTIRYIAERLNVSPGFLLAEEEEEQLYFKSREVENIKTAYKQGDYRLCRQMCQNSEWIDDELLLIHAVSCLKVGEEEFNAGNLSKAVEILEESIEYAQQTIYDTSVIYAEAEAYFDYIPEISMVIYTPSYEELVDITLDTNEFCVYSKFLSEARDEGIANVKDAEDRISLLDDNSPYRLHLSAQVKMDSGKYDEAYHMLHRMLHDGSLEVPEPMLYVVLRDLERCCKEINDFKGAYEYSESRRALLQKLMG